MNPAGRQDFLEFCHARTEPLTRVAYALTADQAAAERLVLRALVATGRRFGSLDDPELYVWRALCASYPRKERAALALRDVAGLAGGSIVAILGRPPDGSGGDLRAVAAQARPVPLGEAALALVERRRRRVTVAVVAGVAVLLGGFAAIPRGGNGGPTIVEPTPIVVRPDLLPPDLIAPPVTDPWPAFTGLGRAPVGNPSDRFVVVSYRRAGDAPNDPVRLLDPATGGYRSVPETVHAVSPDLTYAIVSRQWTESDDVLVQEYGVYDTVHGKLMGRIDLGHTSRSFRRIAEVAWSPDGRTVAFASALGIDGQGWLLDRMILVDTPTGAVRQIGLSASRGYEPRTLLGWLPDSTGLLVAADRVNRDEEPSAHIRYDASGRVIEVHPWAGGRMPYRLADGRELLLAPTFTGNTPAAEVMGIDSGVVSRVLPSGGPVDAALMGGEFLLLRGDELVTLDGDVVAIDVRTGVARVVHHSPERAVHGLVARAPTGVPATATW